MKNIKQSKSPPKLNSHTTVNPDNSIQTFAHNKKIELEGKMLNSKFTQNNSAMIVMTIVIFALVLLCSYSTFQIYQYEKKINILNSTTVDTKKPGLSGSGFDIMFDEVIPNGFASESKEGNFEFIDNKKARITSFVARDSVQGDPYINGIIAFVADYDNKYSMSEFTNKVLDVVGPNYSIDEKKIALDGDSILSKISSKNKRENISFFVTTNNNGYYVFKVYTQGSDLGELSTKSKFVDSIIPKIKLK